MTSDEAKIEQTETQTAPKTTQKRKSGPRPIEQQAADAAAKLARINAQMKKQDAAGKIILGGALLAAAKDDVDTLKEVIELIEKRVTRASDKSRIAPLLRKLKMDLGDEPEQADEPTNAKAE